MQRAVGRAEKIRRQVEELAMRLKLFEPHSIQKELITQLEFTLNVPALQLQNLDDLAGQELERLDFGFIDFSRVMIDGTQRSEEKAVGSLQRNSGIEANSWVPGNEGIVRKPQVFQGIRDHERRLGGHHMAAK